MNELKKGKDGNKASVMRVEYINLLRENGLEIEIEVFSLFSRIIKTLS